MKHDDWIKDGTPTTAPVTASTPELPDETAAVAVAETAPVAETAAPVTDAAPAATTESPAPSPADVAAGAQAAADAAAAAGATPAQQQQAAQEYIEAQLNGQPFQIPKGVLLPLKRGDDVEWKPLDQVQKEGMLERDYRIKTSDLNARMRQFELDRKLALARIAEQERIQREQIDRLAGANLSPEDAMRMATFAELAKNDPFFKKLIDDANTGRVLSAEREVISQEAAQETAIAEAQQLYASIQQISQQYGVDPDRVRLRFSEALIADQADPTPEHIARIAAQEASYATSVVSPLQKQIEELKAQVQRFTDAQAQATHNATTQAAIQRATNPVGAPLPSAGAPVPTPPAANIAGRTIAERSRSWSQAG